MIHSLKIPPKIMTNFEEILLERANVVSFQHSTFCKSCLRISLLSFGAHWMIKWDWNNLSVFFYDLKSWKIHWSQTWKRVIFWPTLDFLTRSFILICCSYLMNMLQNFMIPFNVPWSVNRIMFIALFIVLFIRIHIG